MFIALLKKRGKYQILFEILEYTKMMEKSSPVRRQIEIYLNLLVGGCHLQVGRLEPV